MTIRPMARDPRLAAEAPAKLSLQHLSHSFGTFRALEDVNLDIKPGEFVCILGASGCGKSTLFNAVSGLLNVSSGKILLDGRDIAGRPGEVGYMLQKDLLLPWRTVLGNITAWVTTCAIFRAPFRVACVSAWP
jgi:ABC-type nitrate/sulfonate/bicarbonate transport system ATPase subunit